MRWASVRLFLLLAVLASAAGCANLPQARRSSAAEASVPGAPETAPPGASTGLPRSAEAPRAGSNPAVVALLGSADQKSVAGRLDEAAAALERALRIDPRDAEIWARLADVRLRQGQYRQAESLGLKAAGLAGPRDRELQARCYRVVAQARRAQGDASGAREAEAQARAAAP